MLAALAGGQQHGVTRLAVEEDVIWRVPVRPAPQFGPVEWIERKGPNCVPAAAIRGALLSGPEHVDFLVGNRSRIRAEFDDDCPALDFYGGFYLRPEDARICVKRDAVYSRMGGSCRIERFSHLVPRPRR
jgi:hypothetical protein